MTIFVHIDLSSHVLIFESPWRPNMTSSQTAGFLTYWQSAYHPSICYNLFWLFTSTFECGNKLHQVVSGIDLFNTKYNSFFWSLPNLFLLLQPNAMNVKCGNVETLASSRSDIGTSLGKNVDFFGLFRWITETPGFLRGAAECCHFCWFENGGNGSSRNWWKYGNHTFYFNT